MRLLASGHKWNGSGDVLATITLMDEDETPLFEDSINLSKQSSRHRFAQSLLKRVPESNGKDTDAQLLQLLWQAKGHQAGAEEEPRGKVVQGSQASCLVSLIEDRGVTLFRNTRRIAFVHVQIEDHFEVWRVRSRQFRQWLGREFWQSEGKAANSDAINSALNVIEGMACFDGPEYELHNRVAWYDEALWYDLTDQRWRAVRVTAEGWRIVEHPPILFQRYAHQRGQVEPVPGGNPRRLLEFTNLKDDAQALLLLAYVIACFIPDIPHPIPQLHGEQGSAKSTLFRLIRSLIDPSEVAVLSFPSDISELIQKISHHWVAYFDNVSHLSDWISDILCRASTGEGFTKRELYSDDDDVIYSFRRCVGLNGVNIAAMKPDLLDRVLLFDLERVPRSKRREERELFHEFDQAKPAILGGLFDAIAKAISIYPSLNLKALPRMADFARWGAAAAVALDYSERDFLEAYQINISSQTEEVLSSNPVAEALLIHMEDKDRWEGTASDLLEALSDIAESALKLKTKGKLWPGAPHILTRRLNELRTNLREAGFILDSLARTGQRGRQLVITKTHLGTDSDSTENGVTSVTNVAEDMKQPILDSELSRKGEEISDASDSTLPISNTMHNIEEELGMSVSKVLEIWQRRGAPVIHLGPGENCFDLERLLTEDPVKAHHLEAVNAWLNEAGEEEDDAEDFT